MATITIPDDTLQRLKAKAAARRLSLDAYLKDLAAENAAPSPDGARQLAAIESFVAGMTAWTATHVPPGHVVDDSRERIYEGRGE